MINSNYILIHNYMKTVIEGLSEDIIINLECGKTHMRNDQIVSSHLLHYNTFQNLEEFEQLSGVDIAIYNDHKNTFIHKEHTKYLKDLGIKNTKLANEVLLILFEYGHLAFIEYLLKNTNLSYNDIHHMIVAMSSDSANLILIHNNRRVGRVMKAEALHSTVISESYASSFKYKHFPIVMQKLKESRKSTEDESKVKVIIKK